MILNFRHYTLILNVFFITFYTLYFFLVKLTLHTTFFDILTHTYTSDFYWNNFYYVWTQFFILPSLLILIYYVFNITSLKYKNVVYVFKLTCILLLLFWWVFDYYTINNYCFTFKNTQYFFNNLLNNPLNKYHPILFFSSYIFIYNTIVYINFFTNHRTFHIITKNSLLSYLYNSVKTSFFWILITFSLYLGSWWALQEGSWGGWWNWDASEVFGLLILTLLLILFHFKNKSNSLFMSSFLSYYFSLVILLTYSLLQLSYTLVSHNFGLNLLGYGYVNITFISIITWAINLCFFILFTIKVKSELLPLKMSRTNTQQTLNPITTILVILSSLTLYIYLVSFNPIINNIFWTSFNIEILNTLFYWFNLKLLVVLALTLMIISYNIIIVVIVVLGGITVNQNILIVFYDFKKNIQNKVVHVTIVLTLLTSFLFENTVFTGWVNLDGSYVNHHHHYIRSTLRNNFFVENTYTVDTIASLKTNTPLTPNSFYYFNTSLDTQFFGLDLDTNLLSQVIYNHTYLYLFYVVVWDSPSLITDIVFTLLVVIFVQLYLHKQKIVL